MNETSLSSVCSFKFDNDDDDDDDDDDDWILSYNDVDCMIDGYFHSLSVMLFIVEVVLVVDDIFGWDILWWEVIEFRNLCIRSEVTI